ncbi:MAG: branched-chain amino acid ABC transporter substrate-binding protein [Deltaproteobacteria bacterium]|nr:branched-chain amino acid ABC transporter substrate-binding protein [Deltaproteobacteria bacterium]
MIKGKLSRAGIVTIILLSAMLIPLSTFAADTIKIAVIDPASGPFAAVGDQSNKQYQMIADHINEAGGVLGKKLEIVLFDNKNSPSESVFQLKRAIDQGISIICQGHSSGATAAMLDAVEKHNFRNPDKRVVFLCPDSTEPSLTNEKCNFWFFRWGPTADQKITALIKYLASDKSVKKVFLINMDYSHGHGISAASKKELKERRPDIEIVGDVFHPVGKIKDFAPYINKIKASSADAVVTGDWGTDLNMLIKASHNAGLKAKWITTYAGVIGAPSALQEAGEGTVQVTTWHINYNDGDNETTKFALKFKEKYGVDFYYQEINTMIKMLCSAIENTKSIRAIDIAYALEGMRVNTPTGELLMRADNHQAVMPQVISVFSKDVKYDVEDTGYGWKTLMIVPSEDVYLQTSCKMERPSK